MLFAKDKNKKEELRNETVEEEKLLFVGTPERARRVKYNISATELHAMFEKWRQPEKEIFAEVLKVARETGETATIVVDYNEKGHSHMLKVSEHVYKNMNRSYNEFWI